MEDLLTQVIKISNNFPEIQKAAQEAVDFLGVQQGLIRDPAFELREKCLFPLQLCLETKRNKFTALAVSGFHKMIRDDRFYSSIEPEDDSKWLPLQLLQATNCFLFLADDTKVDILKILLSVACSKKWAINGRIIIAIISLCCEAFESGNAAIRAAAQAAASQTLRSYCLFLEEENHEDENLSIFNEIIPVMQFICSKIDEAESFCDCDHGVGFLLECLLTLFSSLPQGVHSNKHLRTFLWQKLCPVIISMLGTPKVDKFIVTRSSGVEKERGRGSGGLGTAPSFNSSHVKTIYCINTELVRLFGSVSSLRPVLESVFHRVLLYPAPEHRCDALKATAELLRNSNRLLDIAGPLIQEKGTYYCDMSLFRLIMDSIEESCKSSFSVMQAAVICCFGLLKAVEELCTGRCIPSGISELVCNMYPQLSDCNYSGPKTYQSLNRLLPLYRERIQKECELVSEMNTKKSNVSSEKEYDSDSSGVTEGPEDEVKGQILGKDEIEALDIQSEFSHELKMHKLLSVGPYGLPVGIRDTERQHARHFVEALHELLPLLMPMRSSIQIDQALQSFASQYCEGIIAKEPPNQWAIANADGIYLATYSALLLDMYLFQSDYYSPPEKEITVTEEDFVNRVQRIGVVAYWSSLWLRELYQAVVSSSLLKAHGYLPANYNSQPHALINLLTDVEGLGTNQQGSQMLSECRRLEKSSTTKDDNLERESGLRLSRLILTCCWDTLLRVLSISIFQNSFKSKSARLRDLKFLLKEAHHKQIKEMLTISIEGLQIAAKLCNNLGLQDRCDSILELLASASCSEQTEKKSRFMGLQTVDESFVRLSPSHALSLDLLLGLGLELGSHCSECWPHVFRCCIYVRKLEHKYFSKSENRALGSTTKVMRKDNASNASKDLGLTLDPQLEEDTCVDVYSFLCSTELPQTVSELVSNEKHTSADTLNSSETAKVICVLSQLVDKLFEDAALKLNLKSLESFSQALCLASHEQLFPSTCNRKGIKLTWWQKFSALAEESSYTLLIDSIGEFMLKCVRSGRPLFHVMRIWAVVGPHLKESACHKDLTASRKAIKLMHDIINAILCEHSELPHFHVNETLFRPFENLLCLEMCEPDIQDQIVSCICEFVETSFTEIRSGWRPLFGALRVVSTNINILLDVFKIFLKTDNALVFSNAAVDYIMCLIKHFRTQSSGNYNTEIGFETLKYIKRCESVLGSMYKMHHSLVFQSARHIQVSDGLLVDPVLPGLEDFNFQNMPEDLKFESEISYSALYRGLNDFSPCLDSIDRPSGVLRVWFLLLEGLHSAVINANTAFQPSLLDLLYADLVKLIDNPDALFGLFVFNRLVLPMTQSWLRQLSKIEGDFSGLKQSIGLLSDCAVHYFNRLHNIKCCEKSLTLLLNQILLLLSECCIHPMSAVAKIGPACLRHVILSVGKIFTDEQWELVTLALYRTCNITLIFLRHLMASFSVDSEYYYGDAGQVKVAARRGTNTRDLFTLAQQSQQVFLLDEQRENYNASRQESVEDQKMYTFLVSLTENDVVKIPMKFLVIALTSHQSILQIIAEVLLQNTKYSISSLANILNRSKSEIDPENNNCKMPGLMSCLKPSKFITLLSCLDYSYQNSLAFDSRPGLKFLIQKVAGLEQAANLYRQAGAAWAIKLVSLFEYCLTCIEQNHLTIEDIKKLLENSLDNGEKDLPLFLNKIRTNFNELCDTYIKIVIENEGSVSSPNDNVEKPLYFLVASHEEQSIQVNDQKMEIDFKEPLEEEKTEVQKPFYLSEFYEESRSSSDESCDQSLSKSVNETVEKEMISVSIKNDVEYEEENEKEEKEKVKEVEKENKEIDSNSVLSEYKRKKKEYCAARKSPVKTAKEPHVPPEIEQQRRRSFIKDSEALRRVWTEMLKSVFELLQQLSDEKFQILLPIYIDGVRKLMACVSEPVLKQAVSELFQRISVVYGFGF